MVDALPPIFILSTARAGSTLLRWIVDTHPKVYAPAELDLGHLALSLYRTLSGLAGEGIYDPTSFHLEGHPEICTQVRATLDELMTRAARDRGKEIWCEKSPSNLEQLDVLVRVFPEARFLCLYRHYRDVTSSCLEVSRHGFIPVLHEYVRRAPGNSIEAITAYWADSVSAQLDLERRPEIETCRLRYEDLVTAPEQALSPVFAALGLEWHRDLLSRIFKDPHDAGVGDGYVRYSGRIHSESIGKGADLPFDRLSSGLRRRLADLSASLGYDVEERRTETTAVPPARGTSQPGGARAVRLLFDAVLPARLAGRESALPSGTSVCFEIAGEGGGCWVLEVSSGSIQVIPGANDAECRLTLDAGDLLAIVNGKANALQLVEQGRIQVAGRFDDEVLQQLVLLLRTDV